MAIISFQIHLFIDNHHLWIFYRKDGGNSNYFPNDHSERTIGNLGRRDRKVHDYSDLLVGLRLTFVCDFSSFGADEEVAGCFRLFIC